MNPLGINLWNWTNTLGPDAPGLIRRAARMGFTAVELPMTPPEPAGLEAIRAALEETGLAVTLCAGSAPDRSLASDDPALRKNAFDYFSACLRTARALGAAVFCGPMYGGAASLHWLSPEEAAAEWDRAVAGLRALAPLAEDAGCVLALEPLHRYRTSMVNTAAQALRMAQEVNHPAVGVHFDTFHANVEERDVVGAVRTVLEAGKLYHFHACGNDRGAPGTGHLPWGELFTTLRRGGYTGHVTMETFRPGGLDAGWHPVEDDPDEVARMGIACLRKWFSGPM